MPDKTTELPTYPKWQWVVLCLVLILVLDGVLTSEDGKPIKIAQPQHMNEAEAVARCAAYARVQASYPETFEVVASKEPLTKISPNGMVFVKAKFTTSNGFGVKVKYNMQCRANLTELIDAKVY